MVEDPSLILAGIENIDINNSPVPKLLIRIKQGNMMEAIDHIKETWNKIAGDEEFSLDRKSTRLNSSHQIISYAVFCLKKKNLSCSAREPLTRCNLSITTLEPCPVANSTMAGMSWDQPEWPSGSSGCRPPCPRSRRQRD